jgi:pyruvate-formate lyase-activating enzyme
MLTSFNLDHVKVIHIEPTTVCNAACPQCAREDTTMYIHRTNRSELTLTDVQRVLPEHTVANLDKMFMCGNFGDPAASKACLDIYQWFRSINPDITLGMNTNGGLRQPGWWSELGSILNQNFDYTVFAIDGLEDTNHIYRKGVDWHKVMQNAESYIKSGGIAHMETLVFKHNQHQINELEQLARSMGFYWFRAKVTRRWDIAPVDWLEPPTGWIVPKNSKISGVDCHALNENSLYISATGELLPCCWMGGRIFNRDPEIDKAINSMNFQGVIDRLNSDPLDICKQSCGVDAERQSTGFAQQWQKNVQLK